LRVCVGLAIGLSLLPDWFDKLTTTKLAGGVKIPRPARQLKKRTPDKTPEGLSREVNQPRG
jgi:hypothetical protein